MAKKTQGFTTDSKGRVQQYSHGRLPKGMRGVDPECDVHSFTEGPIARLLNRRR